MEATDTQNKIKILIVEDQFIEAYDLQLILEKAGYNVIGIAHSVAQAEAVLAKEKPDLVCLDIFLDENETGIDLAKRLKELHIGFIYISANSGKSILDEVKKTQPYGFILKPFREQDVLTTLEIACYRHRHTAESLLYESEVLQKDIQKLCNTNESWTNTLLQLCKTIQGYLPFDYMDADYNEISEQKFDRLGFFRRNFEEYTLINPQRFADLTISSLTELAKLKTESPQHYQPDIFSNQAFIFFCEKSPIKRLVVQSFGIKSFIVLPVRLQDGRLFSFTFYSKQAEIYTSEHLNLLMHLESALATFVSERHSISNAKVDVKTIPTESKTAPFEGIIGNSKKMHIVFDYIKKVAPSDTSVLILGESGTGKEKVAHAIHHLSSRNEKPFIIVNCGAIPDNLAESMLFGHEKGAFTGALERRIGKFELADNGTIFLDEIGEMPMNLQVKLLRVLQENEIERVGGRAPIKINARIIAATNKNLEEEVASGRFRMDLYYRLHIFPILMPSLRERKEDIPALTEHFVSLYSKKMGRKGLVVPENIMEQIVTYEWPGNIRQLEHVIQRAILLSESTTIKEIQLPRTLEQQTSPTTDSYQEGVIKTINENERDYICYILKKCKGKVYGAGGAAELLDIPASTLNSKIKKLGIKIKAF